MTGVLDAVISQVVDEITAVKQVSFVLVGMSTQVASRLDLWPLLVDPGIWPEASCRGGKEEASGFVVAAGGQLGQVLLVDDKVYPELKPLAVAVAAGLRERAEGPAERPGLLGRAAAPAWARPTAKPVCR